MSNVEFQRVVTSRGMMHLTSLRSSRIEYHFGRRMVDEFFSAYAILRS